MTLTERFLQGDERALSRAISLIEAGSKDGERLLKKLRQQESKARVIGVTGSPGSGKSSLTDALIGVARAQNRKIAVLAIDPSSPFSGGAILGDRIRMMRWHQDEGVYIRSMATRGHLGGLAAASLQAISLLEAYGFDDIFVETVGVGQSEIDIVQVADSTLLVMSPGQGDGVQAFKAGIMEIADVFVINKSDNPSAHRLKREVKAAMELSHPEEGDWWPPIVSTIATKREGLEELWDAIGKHHDYLKESDKLIEQRKQRISFEISASVNNRIRQRLAVEEDKLIEAILSGEMSSAEAANTLFEK